MMEERQPIRSIDEIEREKQIEELKKQEEENKDGEPSAENTPSIKVSVFGDKKPEKKGIRDRTPSRERRELEFA